MNCFECKNLVITRCENWAKIKDECFAGKDLHGLDDVERKCEHYAPLQDDNIEKRKGQGDE